MEMNHLTGAAWDCAMQLHTDLGPGLLESVYEELLAAELRRMGYTVEQQKPISFKYKGTILHDAFRVDLLIESTVIIELKSVEQIMPVHCKQLLTYLRLLDLPVGLLLNFGAARLKEGTRRIINAQRCSL